MLENLRLISWEQLRDAYGPASEVPDLILAASATGGSPFENEGHPLKALYDRLCHQGTVYSATISATPFLIELVLHPSLADRPFILNLLSQIYIASNARNFDGKVSPAALLTTINENLQNFHGLLADDNPNVRVGVAHLMSMVRTDSERTATLIRGVFQTEKIPLIRAGLLLCLASAHDLNSEAKSICIDSLGPATDAERFAAAYALATLWPKQVPDIAKSILVDALLDNRWINSLKKLPWDVEDGIEIFSCLRKVGKVDVLVDHLVSTLPIENASKAARTLVKLVDLTIPINRRCDSPLSDAAKRVLRGVVNSDAAWQLPHVLAGSLGSRCLPTTRPKLLDMLDGIKL